MTGGNRNGMERFGQAFMILGLVLSITMTASVAAGVQGKHSKLIVTFSLCLIMAFFAIDMQLIVNGKYGSISKDDSVYASMKLFADFILIFGLISELL